jgi:diguanylate cyclase (GGDEF)-like protein/PAS domain S-box-containing protein
MPKRILHNSQAGAGMEQLNHVDATIANEAWYKTLIENIPQKIFLKNKDSVYVSCNENMAKSFHMKASEIAGKTDYDLFPKELADKYRTDDRRIMDSGKTTQIEERVIQEGQLFIINTIKIPVKNSSGDVTGILGIIFWDHAASKQFERELQQHSKNIEYLVTHRPEELQKSYEQLEQETIKRKSAEKLLVSIFNSSPTGIYIAHERRYVFFNPEFAKVTRYSEDELKRMDTLDIVLPEDKEKVSKNAISMLKGIRSAPYEFRYLTKDSEIRWAQDTNVSITYQGKRAFMGHFVDIQERKMAEEAVLRSEERYRNILEQMEDSYFELDLTGKFIFVNEATCKTLGYTCDEIIGKNYKEFINGEQAKAVYYAYKNVFSTGQPNIGFSFQVTGKNGTLEYIESSISLIRNSNGENAGFRCVGRNVTERKRLEQKLEELATHDALTGLPTRSVLNDRITMALNQAKRRNGKLAVMMLDLDKFKIVNDSFGHAVGDELLKTISTRLLNVVRKSDTVTRLGGDEFVILLTEIIDIEESSDIARRILLTIKQPMIINGHELNISASIGIAIYPENGIDSDILVKNADAAMYHVKETERGNYSFYSSS